MRRNLFPKETLESPESAYTKLNLRDKNAAEDKNRQTPRNLALFVLNFYVQKRQVRPAGFRIRRRNTPFPINCGLV